MDSLPGRQLPVAVEAVLRSVKQIGGQNDDDQHPGNEKTSDRQSLPKKGENIHWEKILFTRMRRYFHSVIMQLFEDRNPINCLKTFSMMNN